LWWALPQDERRALIEEQSRHITIGLTYMPAIARRLYHCRDIDGQEPFDFLTWFEFAPADEMAFDELLRLLRATEEWRYVDREVEVRLSLATEPSAA
jgi:chlorite dismutase